MSPKDVEIAIHNLKGWLILSKPLYVEERLPCNVIPKWSAAYFLEKDLMDHLVHIHENELNWSGSNWIILNTATRNGAKHTHLSTSKYLQVAMPT